MKRSWLIAAGALACVATASAPQRHSVFGYGGLVGHDGHVDGGPTAIRIDANSGSSKGQVLVAGEEHSEDHRLNSGPSKFPELHITAERIVSVTVKDKVATVLADGRYESGAGENVGYDVRITVTIEDEKGKSKEDHVAITCRTSSGEVVFERDGVMKFGGFNLTGGGAK